MVISRIVLILILFPLSIFSTYYYVHPTGDTNSFCSQEQPCQISHVWSKINPSDTIILQDGTYTGSAYMINPPSDLKGLSNDERIYIQAENDGKVLIDGEYINEPVVLSGNNDYFTIEGINACKSRRTVYRIGGSYNEFKRCIGWDAKEGNNNIFGIHGGIYNLLEDCAGFGIARKTFSSSQYGDFTTMRRCYGRWEGSHVIGPKMAFTFAYNNFDMTIENCIGTWSNERMSETYTLLDYDLTPATYAGSCAIGTYTNYDVCYPYGIFGIDRVDVPPNPSNDLRSVQAGNIAYVNKDDKLKPPQMFFITKLSSITVKDLVAYIEEGSNEDKDTFGLYAYADDRTTNLHADKLTSIGGEKMYIHSKWEQTSILDGRTYSEVFSGSNNVYNSEEGANLCYRYKDRVLTTEKLWPWPMQNRIFEASKISPSSTIDIMGQIVKMFGKVPESCYNNNNNTNNNRWIDKTGNQVVVVLSSVFGFLICTIMFLILAILFGYVCCKKISQKSNKFIEIKSTTCNILEKEPLSSVELEENSTSKCDEI